MLAAAVYAIWKERNLRTFQERVRSVCNVYHEVLYWVRVRVFIDRVVGRNLIVYIEG
jgi:hypothetical protein